MNNGDKTIVPTIIDTQDSTSEESGGRYVTSNGLTKLEHFAGLAMQGLLAADGRGGAFYNSMDDVAEPAIQAAKALLQRLEGGEDEMD